MMVVTIHWLLQALRRFEGMSSIKISGAASIQDLAWLAVELEQEAGAWRVRITPVCWQTLLTLLQDLPSSCLAKPC